MSPPSDAPRTTPLGRVRTFGFRAGALTLAVLAGAIASAVVAEASATNGMSGWDLLRVALIFLTTSWLAWGALQAYVGLLPRRRLTTVPIDGGHAPTVVLIPICNEDPESVFAGVAAMHASIRDAGLSCDIAILSDTRDPARVTREQAAFVQLRAVTGAKTLYYRNRKDNRGRKAGNIEDFVRHSGGAYAFAVILDADSLMEGETIGQMIRRMEADPALGLLQTLPVVVGAKSLFGRAMQFAASFHSPVFARGQARLQGRAGPFWGHNAIVRVRALAESCGLPELSGKPPFGGTILSHDYVEASLLARAGGRVEVDERLGGSYEGAPENLLAYARRDRRWCQGNLQHIRLLTAPGLLGWSRFVFLQGIFAYLASVFWGLFVIASIASAMTPEDVNYFPERTLFPVVPNDWTTEVIALTIGIGLLLILPKVSIWAEAVATGRHRGFGGAIRALGSVVGEVALSFFTAPILLMYQTRSVIEVLSAHDGGWPASQRSEGEVDWATAWRATGWIAATGVILSAAVFLLVPKLLVWMLPLAIPMLLAPVTVRLTSLPSPSSFPVPAEARGAAPVITRFDTARERWTALPADGRGGGTEGGKARKGPIDAAA